MRRKVELMPAPKQPCQTLPQWLRENLGPGALAPLTGTDAKALAAAVQTVQLYAYHSRPEVLRAFGAIVGCMQRSCWPLAYHSIAHVMDWADRETVWMAAGLPPIEAGVCKFERGAA